MENEIPKRSAFVTGLAWTFILMSGFASMISALQVVMVYTMFPAEDMQKAFDDPLISKNVPAVAKFMLANVRLIAPVMGGIWLFTFVASIALLKRANWARIFFVVMLSAGILSNVAGVIFQFSMASEFSGFPQGQPGPDFGIIIEVFKWVSVIMAVALSALFAWVIMRLFSGEIRAEFKATQAAG